MKANRISGIKISYMWKYSIVGGPLRICALSPPLPAFSSPLYLGSPREKGKFFFSLPPDLTEEEERTRAISCLCNAALLAIAVEHETSQSSRCKGQGEGRGKIDPGKSITEFVATERS